MQTDDQWILMMLTITRDRGAPSGVSIIGSRKILTIWVDQSSSRRRKPGTATRFNMEDNGASLEGGIRLNNGQF